MDLTRKSIGSQTETNGLWYPNTIVFGLEDISVYQ